jgi:hypothetical protein
MRIISVKNLLAVNVDDYLCTFFVENEPDFSNIHLFLLTLQKQNENLIFMTN